MAWSAPRAGTGAGTGTGSGVGTGTGSGPAGLAGAARRRVSGREHHRRLPGEFRERICYR
jgi:hypothetical protein